MKEKLELPLLQQRLIVAGQTLLYKAAHEQVAVPIPPYATPPARDLRGHSQINYVNIGANKEVYKFSFLPRTIRVWNLIQHMTNQQ